VGGRAVVSILGITLGLTLAATLDLFSFASRTGLVEVSSKWRAGLILAGLLSLALLVILMVSLREPGKRWSELPARGVAFLSTLSGYRYPLGIGLALAFPLAVFGPTGRFLTGFFPRLLLFWVLLILVAAVVHSLRPRWGWWAVVLGTALGMGGVIRLAAFLPELSSQPFSLGWSEASRYYYASLLFSRPIYGFAATPSVLHPTRYLLQALAFLIPNSPIWFHRFWQVALWITTSAAAGLVLARRFSIREPRIRWLAALWVALFLLQGPVYYHLLVMVILIGWWFRADRPWRNLGLVLAASIWAGLSRINWFPVPGLLATELFLLERRFGRRAGWPSIVWPAVWVLGGTLVAGLAQLGYALASGNPSDRFTSSFTSDLLWYRLGPNLTNPLGILPAILLASVPVLLWAGLRVWPRRLHFHPLRILGVGGILTALLAGGLVVSVKIGGGSNLHNLDAYLVAVAILGGYLVWREVPTDRPLAPAWGRVPWGVQVAAVFMPVAFAIGAGAPAAPLELASTQTALDEIRREASPVDAQGDEVLFIAHRQLLTFGDLEAIRLVPEHELVFLMEMAISHHRPYLDAFRQDLERQRFGLIITYPLETEYQGRSHAFGEENDTWVREVSEPILCSYEPRVTLRLPPLQILVPRRIPADCPGVTP